MSTDDERGPLVTGQQLARRRTAERGAALVAAKDERPGVARVVQRAQHPPVQQRGEDQLPLVGTGTRPGREQQLFVRERLDHSPGRAGAGEGREQVA